MKDVLISYDYYILMTILVVKTDLIVSVISRS